MIDHSQNGEQAILLEHFADAPPGRLLDCGAWAVESLSNSRALIERGWSAVLVEPSPKPFCGLLDAYGGNPNVTLVNVAVAETAGLKTWHDSSGDAVSTLDTAHRDKWAKAVNYRDMILNTCTVAELLAAVGIDFTCLLIDTEATSAQLLRLFPLEEMTQCRGIVVEHDGHADALSAFVRTFGYAEATRNAENSIFLR